MLQIYMAQTLILDGLAVGRDGKAVDQNPRLCSSRGGKTLRTAQAFATVQAFVARPIADSDVTAIRTGRRVLLKVRYGLAQIRNFAMPVRHSNIKVSVLAPSTTSKLEWVRWDLAAACEP